MYEGQVYWASNFSWTQDLQSLYLPTVSIAKIFIEAYRDKVVTRCKGG